MSAWNLGRFPKTRGLALGLVLLALFWAEGAKAEEGHPSPQPRIERGQPNWLIDALGNVLGLPGKLILLNPKVDNHSVSPATEQKLREYIEANQDKLGDVTVRLNQWTPVGDLKGLIRNKKVEWYFRLFPGLPVTLFSSLTGRLLGGDNYNPYTNTIHLYSDDPAIALHEAGHAKDFAENPSPGLYALGRFLPPIVLHQEQTASETALQYLKDTGDRKEELHAYSTLYPAFGTYAGSEVGLPYGNWIGAGVGHILGVRQRYESKLGYQALDEAHIGGTVQDDELSRILLARREESRATLLGALQKNR